MVAIVTIALGLVLSPTDVGIANAGQDCDSNAVIYCGITSRAKLKEKLTNGTGRQYQSASELQSLFAYYRIYPKDVYRLRDGYVTKDNRVVVPGYNVKNGSNVYSMGRSYMSGSTRVSRFPYPIYLRHPSVSFRSNSIPAYVYMNPDSTFAYAVIKSCGNIVPGKLYSAPEERHKLTIWKYEDLNLNKVKDANERYVSDWYFDVRGPNGKTSRVKTSANGGITITRLLPGKYTITELTRPGWRSITGLTQTVNISNQNVAVSFGNVEVQKLTIWKYEDLNRDGQRQENEPMLPNWQFDVNGPRGYRYTTRTTANGGVTITRLLPGEYTITEHMQDGWRNTTPRTQRVTIARDGRVVYFGNTQIYEPFDERVNLNVAKFHDIDGDGDRDEEETMLPDWRFRVTGPNGYENTITTQENGIASLSELEPGNYVVTEILIDGWENTTGLTVQRTVTIDPATQSFVFGNRETDDPKTPGGETALPASGPMEAAATAFGTFGLSGSAIAWMRSKKRLLGAFRK